MITEYFWADFNVLFQIQEESQRHKTDYEKVYERCVHDKAKYDDAQARGKRHLVRGER